MNAGPPPLPIQDPAAVDKVYSFSIADYPCAAPMDKLPAVLVSDRAQWIREAKQACRAISAIPEHETWKSAFEKAKAGSALVLDVADPFDQKRDHLERLARRAWQPLCVLCVSSQRGAAELVSWASGVGYRYTVHGDELKDYCGDLENALSTAHREPNMACPGSPRCLIATLRPSSTRCR